MSAESGWVDVHCHLLPGVDDGAATWEESLAMARMAVDDGTAAIVCTPHQLGGYAHNRGDAIRQQVHELQRVLCEHNIPLQIAPGADVRIDQGMIAAIRSGEVLTLADHRRHILLELPHEMYFPLEPVLDELENIGIVGVLSHPERNVGIMHRPELLQPLVERGCLMQVTAGSLTGTFGPESASLAEWMLEQGLVHLLASDAHGVRSRRPLLERGFRRAVELVGEETATLLCQGNPYAILHGQEAVGGRLATRPARSMFGGWFGRGKAA